MDLVVNTIKHLRRKKKNKKTNKTKLFHKIEEKETIIFYEDIIPKSETIIPKSEDNI